MSEESNPSPSVWLRKIWERLGAINGAPGLLVENGVSSVGFDLASAAYDASSALATDYILDTISFQFTTTQTRTITITRPDGSVLYQEANTNLEIVLEEIDEAFVGGTNFRIQITQTVGACLVDVLAKVFLGTATLIGAADIANFPSDYPDAAVLAKVEAVMALLAAPLAVTGPLTDAELAARALATSAKQDLLLTELQLKADLTETQPVSAASLPLPAGAATAAKQLPDGHNVAVSNFPATQVVAGSMVNF